MKGVTVNMRCGLNLDALEQDMRSALFPIDQPMFHHEQAAVPAFCNFVRYCILDPEQGLLRLVGEQNGALRAQLAAVVALCEARDENADNWAVPMQALQSIAMGDAGGTEGRVADVVYAFCKSVAHFDYNILDSAVKRLDKLSDLRAIHTKLGEFVS